MDRKRYKPGAILKVSVLNFVTHTYTEMYPGANLNMIIGSNGTGKSTMVAAIILGLGGNPTVVGRGTKISEYIKHTFTEAKIEILLNGASNDTILVTREFNIHDKTTWKLNKKKATFKEVEECIRRYNIQVNNLCQFLPQDRVQDFAKMNKQELLKQTKKAICREDLVKKHEVLIEKHKRCKSLVSTQKTQSDQLQEMKDANVRMESMVKNFNKRKEYIGLIKDVARKITWMNYEALAEKREAIRADKAQAAEIVASRKAAVKPIEGAIAKVEQCIADALNKIKRVDGDIKTAGDQVTVLNSSSAKLKETISVLQVDMLAKIQEIERTDTEINSSTIKLDQLTADKAEILKTLGSDQMVADKLQRFSRDMKQISSQMTLIREKKVEILSMKRERGYEIQGLENELTRIENVRQQRLEWLRRSNGDAYKATLWVRDNKHLFKCEVHEPMMLELNVINPDNAKYVENTIPMRDRVAFTCTDKDDMNLLIRSLRNQQHLSVNVVHSGNDQPAFTSYRPVIPIEQLKKYGLYAYLHTLFTGPEAIMKYLCKTYRIHCVPIGNESTNSCFEDVPREIYNFFSNNFRFSASYSTYTGQKSIRQVEIRRGGSLAVSVNTIRLEEIRGQINQTKLVCETYDDEVRELDNQITQLNERYNKLRESHQVLKNSKQQIETIDGRIRLMKKKINDLKQMTTTKEDLKQSTDLKIQELIKKMLTVQTDTLKACKTYTDIIVKKHLSGVKVDVYKKEILILENKSVDVRRLYQEAEDTLNVIKDKYAKITNEAKQALLVAKEASNGYTPEDEGFEEFRDTYDKLSNDVEELNAERVRLTAKIGCMRTADDGEMKEYDRRVRSIEELEAKIISVDAEVKDIEDNMERLREDYMTPLQKLVGEINQRFGTAFQNMELAGEVTLYTGDNDKDYEQYGLSIRVTYRSGQPLQELTMLIQSGGERAVATAAYMLSLQELTPVPFRCVDEINQGMDPDNERRIFDLLVQTTSIDETAQYFFITPKLVKNLPFPRSAKVQFIHNAPFIPRQQHWNELDLDKDQDLDLDL